MIHLLLLLVCILSVEILIRFNFLSPLDSILKITKKVTYVIPQNNISDHWKEKMVPVYAFILLKNSLLILGILFLIILVFSAFIVLSSKFLTLILSITGVAMSIVVSFTYLKLRVIFLNE